MEIKEILEKLVAINTVADKDNNKLFDFVESFLKELGFITEKKEKYLIMRYGDNPKLGFVGHADTVEYIDGWKTNPFELTEKDGYLYGLGSVDMKGGIASFLYALQKIDLKSLQYGIKVYITYNEENGLQGIKDIVASLEEFPEYMIIGEPTNNVAMTACKGLFTVNIHTDGIKVHSSTPDKGRSAISSMMKILTELEDYYQETIKVQRNELYEVPYTTMNIGLFNGGSAFNSVAKECSSYIDFRVVDNKHIEMIKEKLTELCNNNYGRYEVGFDIEPFDNDVEFIKEKASAGFMTEASFIKDKKRIILGVGPVTAHEIDEHVSIESLEKCIKEYREIINNVCI